MRTEDFTFSGAELLMPLDTPLLRVSRPVAACQRCRTAKIKCDGKLPACSACERSNRASECSSTNDQFAKGKERSYVATLEARVERLERRIGEVRARRKSSLQMLDAVLSSRRISIDENGRAKNVRAARRKELLDIDELVSDFGFLYASSSIDLEALSRANVAKHRQCHVKRLLRVYVCYFILKIDTWSCYQRVFARWYE